MRPWLPTSLVLATVMAACASPRPASAPALPAPTAMPVTAPAKASEAPASPGHALFDSSVKPILVSRCMPCHFPGGKMYDRMPFDDPAVVASHSEGVLRRIKDPDQRQALDTWLAKARE